MNRVALIASIGAWLAACAGVPDAPVSALPGEAALPLAWSQAPASAPHANTADLALNDPLLSAFVEQALAQNPDLRVAGARVDRARALAAEARASLWPALSVSASLSDRGDWDQGAEGGLGSLSLTPSWEVDLWGRLAATRQSGDLSLQASQADFEAARLALIASVAEAYILAIAAGRQAGVVEQTFDRLSSTLGFIEVQADRGLRSGADIALIRADVETTRAALLSAEAAERDALRALELLIGTYPATQLEISDQLPDVPALLDPATPADLLRSRPDLKALEFRMAAAARQVDAAKADRLPRLTLGGSLEAASGNAATLFDPTNMAWQALAELSMPVLDGGARRARLDARRAELSAAVAAYQGQALSAFGDVEQALNRSSVLGDREEALLRARTEARQALAFVQYRFEGGDGDLLDVLAVQNRVASLDASVVAVRQQRIETHIALTLALGREVSVVGALAD